MRDRLIELLKDFCSCRNEDCKKCGCCGKCFTHKEADYLLENGVIVSPCKVGDVVYDIHNGKVFGGKISSFTIFNDHIGYMATGGRYFWVEDIGKTVFLTKEEAEQALKGGVQE